MEVLKKQRTSTLYEFTIQTFQKQGILLPKNIKSSIIKNTIF